MNYTVHVVPHTHWDREWYLPFEVHRARLVEHMDRVLEQLASGGCACYHLDGQAIALDDYLEIRPEKRELVEKYVRSGRLKAGPWYVLQDEYLTGGEAHVRNLYRGLKTAEDLGGACRIGYQPDAFGNVGQMPQLLCQAGMTAAAFGRGVTLTADGSADPAGRRPRRSEFLWESPDGSRLPALFFSGWYNNGQEIPADPALARAYWDPRLARATRYAATGHLLFMNGSDHQPVQRDLPQALETARRLYPDITFLQSDLEQYARAVLESLDGPLETVPGELAGQETAGDNTLCNTASSRAPLKAMNRYAETLLTQRAEPLAVMAALSGGKADGALLDHAWKLLMQNHPHDSICGCGVDAVHREMEGRYEKCVQLAGYLADSAGKELSRQIAAPGLETAAAAFAVCNPSGWPCTGTAEAVISLERLPLTAEARSRLLARPAGPCRLTDSRGREIPCTVEDLGVRFGYTLPEDSFRRPYYERQARVRFQAEEIPAFGYETYYLREEAPAPAAGGLVTGPNRMENAFVRVEIREDGSFDLTEKETGRVYRSLGWYEDVGDVGDEYIFQAALGEPLTTRGRPADVTCLEDGPCRAAFQITHRLEIPRQADGALAEAMESMEPRLQRRIGRGRETTVLELRATLILEAGNPVVRLRTEFENTARDHRLRAVFPTGRKTDRHLADSVFDVVDRPDLPGPRWTNPSRCQRMQMLAAAEDEGGGLAVINRGVYEYEMLPEEKAVAVTLVRSVGEMGDWGVFPTPEAQCQGRIAMDLGLLAYGGGALRQDGCRHVWQFQQDMPAFQIFESDGVLPERGGFLDCAGEGLVFTALKPAEDNAGYVLRLFNALDEPSALTLRPRAGHACYRSDVLERKHGRLQPEPDGLLRIPVRGKEILTLRFESV